MNEWEQMGMDAQHSDREHEFALNGPGARVIGFVWFCLTEILRRAAECVCELRGGDALFAQTEVNQPNVTIRIQQHVLTKRAAKGVERERPECRGEQ